MRRALFGAAGALLVAALPACDVGLPAGRTPHREGNFLDMVDHPKQKPQRGDLFGSRPTGMIEPPPGTVATTDAPYPYAQAEADLAGQALVNPLPASPEVITHGQFVYENVCIACHGKLGAGDGPVTALFPKPPSLITQKVRDWPDGQIYHRPARGQGSMPSHARQVAARDIWSVVHYLDSFKSQDPFFQYQMEEIDFAEPSEINPEEEIVRIGGEAVEEVLRKKPEIKGFSGFTDARFYINQYQIPALIFRPGGVEQSHTLDESVEVEALIQAAHIYAWIVTSYLSKER